MRSTRVLIEGSDTFIIVQKDSLEFVSESGKSHRMKRSFLWGLFLPFILRFKLKKIGVNDSVIIKKVIDEVEAALNECA